MVGCLVYGIITVLIGVSLCVSLDLESDSAGGMFVIFLCVLGPIIAFAIKGFSDDAKQRQIAEEQRLEQERKDDERRRIAETTQKVEVLKRKYDLKIFKANATAVSFNIDTAFVNKEIILTVKDYKERMATTYEQYATVAKKIKQILDCNGYTSVDAKYLYLSNSEETLKQLKEEGERCLSHLSSCKIELLNEDIVLLAELKQAFQHLINSKKCNAKTANTNIKKFVVFKEPNELALFRYKSKPVTLFFEQHYFCLFSTVILVFDESGVFSTAIDPSALKILIKKETVSVNVSNGNTEANEYIAEDSKRVSQGVTNTTWLYTCRDGSPDLRYSYNPRLEYRTDTYEYVNVEFVISNKKISFSASSSIVADTFKKVAPKYAKKMNHRHNPIPDLLILVKDLSCEEKTQIDNIIQIYSDKADTDNYFCKLTTC